LRLVEAIRGLRRKKLAVDELLRDFGPKSETAVRMVNTFYNKVVGSKSPKVEALFNDWKRLFSQVCAYSPEKLKGLEAEYDLSGEVDYSALLFAVHTYYALVMKLLAAEVAYLFGAGKWLKSYVAELEDANMKGLEAFKRTLEDLESGGVFRRLLNITNFIEGDYFSWYLEELDQEAANRIADLAKRLADYEPATPVLEPEYTRDLLKRLYQNLVPKKIRHDLGEYYTPDWLAELLLNEVGLTVDNLEGFAQEKSDLVSPLNFRVLDPACGSGTFLVLAMKRFREYAERHYLKDVLSNYALKNIIGFDLNPLAVLTARTNYLLAIADLLTYAKGPIEIPVYLADSLLVEAKPTLTGISYIVRTYVEKFELPKSVIDKGILGKLLESVDRYVRLQYRIEDFKRIAKEELKLTEEELRLASALYATFLKLEQEGRNHVWTAIIKNAFAPITTVASYGKFDYVIGNPPWVNWENLPEDYRNASAELWGKYGLKAKATAEQFELGKMKRDISMLFLYVCADRYLANHGMFGFLITQMVFKTKGAEVFRRFRLPEGVGIKVLKVHDMVDLKPFEAAANMTSMIILKKGVNTKYPVPYIRWTKTKECDLTNATLEEVFHICSQDELIAVPIDTKDNTSQWLTVNKKVLSALDKIRGSSHYEPHLGVNTGGANGVYWIKIVDKHPSGNLLIENLYDIGKRKLEKIAALIEPKHIFKLIRSGDLNRWLPTPTNYIIVPHTEQTDWQAIPEHKLRVESPKTYEYLLHFKEMLLKRSAYTLLRKGHPFYIMVDIRKNSFAPYKVAWKRMGDKINASVLSPMEDKYIGKKPLIPQETISFIPLKQEDEAHYLCSILNSSEVTFLVKSFSQLGGKSFATPSILGQINILKYDPENPIHRKLAELSKKAHQLASEKNTYELSKIEEDIDNTVAELYGLTDEEAKEIKNALKTLEGEEIEKEIVEEESIEVKVDFLSAVASPNVAGSFEVAISNPLKDTVRIELQLPDRKVELETDKEQETVKVQVPPLEAGEYKIPYKIITRSKVARGEFTLHVKEKKRFRKDETLTSKLDELLGDKG
jgi:methylase of polypeptide subunit release factors